MIRQTLLFLLASTAVTAQPSFKGFLKTNQGAYYKIINPHEGRKPSVGDYVKVHLINATAKDSVIFSTYNASIGAVEFKLAEGNDVAHILPYMSKGDSAIAYLAADSLYKIAMPPYAKSGDWVKYTVKLLDTWTTAEFELAKEEKRQKMIAEEGKLIEEYLNGHGMTNYQKMGSGIFYVSAQEGTGDHPVAGQSVTVHYTGTLLNGKKFDSSRDREQPFTFELGKGKVIKGWDEGIPLFRLGGRGKLYIPSPLAYGENGAGTIPPNAILVFDIELLSMSSEGLVLQGDIERIQKYLGDNNISANQTSAGLFYKIDQPGTGANAAPGNNIKVHYTGKLLNGTKFDSSHDRGQPLPFQLGAHQVIKGWDLGLRYFNEGAKGTLYIPSPLAYGERGFPPGIPANAILVFEVELVDIE